MPKPESTPSPKPPSPAGPVSGKLMGAMLIGAVVLVAVGGAAFYYASSMREAPAASDALRVAVTDSACEPNELSVSAGRRTFEIHNRSDRPVEWEILDGVMVVEERENIAPGLRQTFSARVEPGTYTMTCGLLSNPTGILNVTPSTEAVVAGAAPPLQAFIGPLSEYQFYLARQGSGLVTASEALAEAIDGGDLDSARSLYAKARIPFKHLEPVIYRFSDLENALNPTAAYLEKREADPAFTGFHRIAYGLFAQNSLDGLKPVAERLVADAKAAKDRVRQVKLTPAELVQGAAHVARQLASSRIVAGEDAYTQADLFDIDADLEGMSKVLDLVAPVMATSAPEATNAAKDAFAKTRAAIDAKRGPDGFPAYDTVVADDRKALAASMAQLADALDGLLPAMTGIGQS